MKIASLIINGKKFNLKKKNTFIYSKRNSVGKTSFLRCLLFAMGYNIPSTKGMNMNNLNLEVDISRDDEVISLNRNNERVTISGNVHLISLKEEQKDVLSIVYGIENPLILDNILGLHYFDQEKGWTLLNRGKVIGSIHFKIENLIEGLGEVNLNDMNIKLKRLSNERKIYTQLLKLVSLQEEYKSSNYVNDDTTSVLNAKLRLLNIQSKRLKKEIDEYSKIRKDNEKLITFIEESRIRIRTDKGELVNVDRNHIVGYDANQELIIVQIERKRRSLLEIETQIAKIQKQLNDKLDLVNIEDQLSRLNNMIDASNIDINNIETVIKEHTKEITKTNKKIREILYRSEVTEKIFSRIKYYSKILGIESSLDSKTDFIYTSNLKRYSGAKLHLLVYAFKLALLKEVQTKVHQTFPIILDSPVMGELDNNNLSRMFMLLSKEFKDNQIIVSSIYDLDSYYDWDTKITLEKSLME
ncbi:hypothetical protein ACLUX0_08570 [Limosilactobacillus mucosae]